MCGIAGILHPDTDRYKPVVRRMVQLLEHRGPDDEGIWSDDNIVLGHRRLSIIDLSETGHQPLPGPSGQSWVILNGEIYNYRELRSDLIEKGHQFRGSSDTEVIPHLYEDAPERFVEQLGGMFAFALWDSRSKCLTLARDRAGKKPLFYAAIPDGYAFASEIKALLAVPDVNQGIRDQGVHDYLSFGVVPGPDTIYSGIYRVPPAHVMNIHVDGPTVSRPFWQLDFSKKIQCSKSEAVEEIDRLLTKSVKLRLRSDVPVGCFLSGGIDSGLVTAIAAKEMGEPLKTFCVGFDDGAFDERPLARLVAKRYGTDHEEAVLSSLGQDRLHAIIGHYDEPFADQSALPSFLVSEMASKKLKVILNGDGSDEIFAGYRHYLAFKLQRNIERFGPLPKTASQHLLDFLPRPKKGRSPYQFSHRLLRVLACTEFERYLVLTKDLLSETEKQSLYAPRPSSQHLSSLRLLEDLKHQYGNLNAVDQMSGYNFQRLLGDTLLIKMDMASMAHSLEARSPFLDHSLIEFAAQLPPGLKLGGRQTKPLLRELAKKYLPNEVVRAPKRGFEIPLQKWMTGQLNPLLRERLTDRASLSCKIFDPMAIDRFLSTDRWDLKRWSSIAWMLLCLEIWWSHQNNATTIKY